MTVTNPPRTGATTGTGCRGRPPKIRKDIPIQSSVISPVFLLDQKNNFIFFLLRISMKFVQHE